MPVADGGEGETCEALAAALGGEWREAIVSDPLGRPIPAPWLSLQDGRAVVEAAAAVGLPLLARSERDPLRASSRGLGELLLAVHAESPASVIVGLGGSATVDGGAGMRGACASSRFRPSSCATCGRRFATPQGCSVLQKGATEGGPEARAPARRDGRAQAVRRSRGAGAAGGLGAALAALGQISSREPRRFSTSSASTKLLRATTSSSRARGRSTRRPPRKGAGRDRATVRGRGRPLCRLRRTRTRRDLRCRDDCALRRAGPR